jgi:hypothetical protein
MHVRILGAALVAAGAQAVQARTDCPRPDASVVIERFISADCPDCWTRKPEDTASAQHWLFDWIVPASRGEDAFLSPAAPPESLDRLQRATGAGLADGHAATHRTALRTSNALRLSVTAGPAWNGYFGVQLDAKGPVPRGSSGWLALVEVVPPGTDGTPVARQLVRAVSGPLALAGLGPHQRVRSLHALRWPESAKPERLRARAWIEGADGRILAMAGEGCATR